MKKTALKVCGSRKPSYQNDAIASRKLAMSLIVTLFWQVIKKENLMKIPLWCKQILLN